MSEKKRIMTQQPDNTPQRDSTPAHSRDGIDLSQIPSQSAGQGGSEQSWVLDNVDQQSLQTLLQHAASVPLIIHLAAPSNPASGQIDAVLQPAIDARAGRMVMGRINTEQYPQLLQMFGVPSAPMVIAVWGRRRPRWSKDRAEAVKLENCWTKLTPQQSKPEWQVPCHRLLKPLMPRVTPCCRLCTRKPQMPYKPAITTAQLLPTI